MVQKVRFVFSFGTVFTLALYQIEGVPENPPAGPGGGDGAGSGPGISGVGGRGSLPPFIKYVYYSPMFLPVSRDDMKKRGWDRCDFIMVSGDAYVDHPSFGAPLIARVLEAEGYRVGFISQPRWDSSEDFEVLGRPSLGFLVTSGNMDSMVNHYTAAKKVRRSDAYSPGAVRGRRPDRAVIVYTSRIRQACKGIPVILGGIEASLRRLGHYDYWSNKVRRSILMDSKADMIVYGMGENTVKRVAALLASGKEIQEITDIPGTVVKVKAGSRSGREGRKALRLPSFSDITGSKQAYAKSFRIQYENTDAITAAPLAENYGDWDVLQNIPASPLSGDELDAVYELPFTRKVHPEELKKGDVPAIKEVKFSIVSSRGCFGGCSYCSLTFLQGRTIQARSRRSILAEAERLTKEKDFKGYIHDVGGPTANFRKPSCTRQLTFGVCKHKQCLYPEPCGLLEVDHEDYTALLREIRSLPGIKKVFIRSGIRYDYILAGGDNSFIRELAKHHVSGQLKVAPEHVSAVVLDAMQRPGIESFLAFGRIFSEVNKELGKKQYLIPYLISSHPGSGLKEAVELAEFLRDYGFVPDQVQDFYPTPGTLSTAMYHTGLNPLTMKPVYVPDTPEEKAMQRALIHYKKPENYKLVRRALVKAGREDLIGRGKQCLISFRPRTKQ